MSRLRIVLSRDPVLNKPEFQASEPTRFVCPIKDRSFLDFNTSHT